MLLHIFPRATVFIILIVMILGTAMFSYRGFERWEVRNLPIASGTVITRKPTDRFFDQVDFQIQPDGQTDTVHAFGGKYLLQRVPRTVRFHYSGNPSQEVYLFEHEDNPFLFLLFTVPFSLFSGALLFTEKGSAALDNLRWRTGSYG